MKKFIYGLLLALPLALSIQAKSDAYTVKKSRLSHLERKQFSVDYWNQVVYCLKSRRGSRKNDDYIKRAETSLRRAETILKHERSNKGLPKLLETKGKKGVGKIQQFLDVFR